jgi:hypothetical protein
MTILLCKDSASGETGTTHFKEISIYAFPEKELRDLSPNFHIHMSVSNQYIPTISPPIFLQQNRQTDCGNISIAQRNMNVGIKTVAAQFLFWEYLFRISALCLCSPYS